MFNLFLYFTEIVIGWDAIRIQLIICLAIAIVLSIVFGILASARYRKCVIAHNAGDWNYIIKQEKTLIKISRSKSLYEGCMYMLAAANFELNHDEEFLAYLNKLTSVKYVGRKLYLEANYLIVTNEVAPQPLDDILHSLSLLEDDDSKKCFEISTLLYEIKFKHHICSQEELETLKEIKSDRIKKAFSL